MSPVCVLDVSGTYTLPVPGLAGRGSFDRPTPLRASRYAASAAQDDRSRAEARAVLNPLSYDSPQMTARRFPVQLACSRCDATFAIRELMNLCPNDGAPLLVRYDIAKS